MKRILIYLILLSFSLSGCQNKEKIITASNFMLNTVVVINIYDSEEESLTSESFKEIGRLEKILSADYDGGDLYNLNKGEGLQTKVAPELFYVLKESIKYSELSGGMFDASIGPLVSLWEIKDGTGNVPEDKKIEEALNLINYKEIELTEPYNVKLGKDMKVHLGAIAKGYIADCVKDMLMEKGVKSAIINLGGNVLLIGGKPDGGDFKVGIQNPYDSTGSYIGIVRVKDKSIVSSGSYERFFEKDGKTYHHILNPFTGFPADNELIQTTIISEKSLDGDALSTTAFLLGLKDGYAMIEGLENTEAIFVTRDKKVYLTSGLDEKIFTLTNKDYSEMEM